MATRSKTEVYLLGSTINELTGSKLPSVHMALGFFLHQHLELKKPIRQASAITIKEIKEFWEKARIPVRDEHNCQNKLQKCFEEWRLLKKNKGRSSKTQKEKEETFVAGLKDLFDIAHANALDVMTIDEDKEFLLAQREKGRKGSMAGVDKKLAVKEKKSQEIKEKYLKRKAEVERKHNLTDETIELASSSCTSTEEEPGTSQDEEVRNPSRKRKRGTKEVISPELASALDSTELPGTSQDVELLSPPRCKFWRDYFLGTSLPLPGRTQKFYILTGSW